MKPEDAAALRELLSTERVLALAVLVDGAPYVGMLPYVMTSSFDAVLIHASQLARHSRGLLDGAPFSALIHRPDDADADPAQLPRATLQGTIEVLERGGTAYDHGRQRYIQRFPTSERTFMLGDFNLYRLAVTQGRYVGGFARALNFSPRDLGPAD